MTLTTYYITDEPELVAVYDEAMGQLNAWRSAVFDLCKQWGFDFCSAHDFKRPHRFAIRCERDTTKKQGPKIDGFKGGKVKHMGGDDWGYEYTIYASTKLGKQYKKMLDDINKKYRPEEMNGHRHFFGGVVGLICERLSLSTETVSSRAIHFSSVCKLGGSLVVSYPFGQNNNTGMYDIPDKPKGWREITSSRAAELMNHEKYATKDG